EGALSVDAVAEHGADEFVTGHEGTPLNSWWSVSERLDGDRRLSDPSMSESEATIVPFTRSSPSDDFPGTILLDGSA
ncbi:MAG: hypothetical protein ACRC1K_01125, partial [Planctomycetia bacterium]